MNIVASNLQAAIFSRSRENSGRCEFFPRIRDGLRRASPCRILIFDDLVAQFVPIARLFRKVLREEITGFRNRLDQRVTETFILKLRSHRIDQLLPECVAAFFVNAAITDHGKFLHPRRDENQDAVALASIGHPEFVELLLRRGDGIADRASLNVNANLPGRFRFRRRDRLHDPVVIQFKKEIFCPHVLITNFRRHRRHRSCRRRR